MISSIEEMSCMTAHLFYCQPEKNEFWRKTFKFTLIAEKLLCVLPLTSSRYGYSWKILYINRHGKHVRERLPSRLQKIYCKEYVLSKFLLPTSLWDSSTITKWTSGRFLIASRKTFQRTLLQPSIYNTHPASKGDFQACLGFPVPLHSMLENRLLQSDLLWYSGGDKLPRHCHSMKPNAPM